VPEGDALKLALLAQVIGPRGRAGSWAIICVRGSDIELRTDKPVGPWVVGH
jgi:hypothetical protein